ncbi:tryptophan 7-halogenase [Glaciecola sp. 1036]|uniref:tryptophan 7-halogenase n=1 Tax=Alteromonadaceae TaxID=72275 RepID=UPI003D05E0F7
MLTHAPIKQVVILGGGAVGWSAAVGLARGLQGQDCQISVVDLPIQEPELIAAGPQIFDYHKILGIQERQLLQSGHAKLSLAQAFSGFNKSSDLIFNSFDTSRPEFCSIEFHHLMNWFNLTDFADYSIPSCACKQQKLALPKVGNDPVQSSFTCGMHLNTQVYRKFMQGAANQLGVKSYSSLIDNIEQAENGFVTKITLQDGTSLAPDLVIDNSGYNSLVMRRTFNLNYQSHPLSSSINRRIECLASTNSPALPYSTHSVLPCGWKESIQMANIHSTSVNFNQNQFSDQQVIEAIGLNFDVADKPVVSNIHIGHLTHFFYHNCVAIGEAAGYVASPSMTNLVMSQRAITKLLDLFPNKACLVANTNEYNRRVKADYSEAFDYLAFHYQWAKKQHPKLECVQEIPTPSEKLQQRIGLFESTGRVAYELNPMITRQSWLNVLQAFCAEKSGIDPLVGALDKENAKGFLNKLKQAVQQHVHSFNAYR